MKTLGNLKRSSIPQAIGIGACDPRFTLRANEAQNELASMGRWWGSTKRMRICVTSRCITWPAGVATVDGFNIGGWGVPPRNDWFEFQDNVRVIEAANCSCSAQQLLDRGFTPQYRDITANSYIRIYPVSSSDYGAVILLQGNDQNGNPIRNSDADGWFDGEKLTIAAAPFSTSTYLFHAPGLLGVQKPITNSYLNVFAVNGVTGVETQIARWGPSETAPQYRRSALVHLPRSCNLPDRGDGCRPGVENCTNVVAEAIVRLEPIELVADSDWLLIGNEAAMKSGMKAADKEDKNDYAGAGTEWSKAIMRLREELAKYDPPERMSINFDLGATMSRPLGRRVF